MKLEIDLPILLTHAALFISLIFLLKFFYFDPVIALLRRRESLVGGRSDEADRLQQDGAQFKLQYDEKMAALRKELESVRGQTLQNVRNLAERSLSDARERVAHALQSHEKQLAKDLHEARQRLPQLAQNLGTEIVLSVQGRGAR